MDTLNQLIPLIAVLALPMLFAITVHEAAHGWVASRRGDKTALMLGRVTFNPLKHIDPVGTIAVPLGIFLLASLMGSAPILFGWAKPVPVNWRNLQRPRLDMALVAVAGPTANLLMALAWGLMIKLGALLLTTYQGPTAEWLAMPLIYMGAAGVLINLLLMVLNLFPLLPLDGGRVLNAALPPRLSRYYSRLEPFGLMILILMLFTGALTLVLFPAVSAVLSVMPGAGIVRELFPL
ncbi:site-2 protease family protein [Thiorhodovibrio frisius]|uniref:Zn-dependent protease n=1 Tax=Thiorhodovibrio frisius TaxID=631362 RepID=H8Z3K0_9GAMM|nr:site-2 protease family protein [Thiorhodovibrio frisius]EIC21908.1 Zn-dependent protease [Thiorhodovibrio frisius]WPL24197.1 Zn-dependent protease [Thiorhodovibrio frisius]